VPEQGDRLAVGGDLVECGLQAVGTLVVEVLAQRPGRVVDRPAGAGCGAQAPAELQRSEVQERLDPGQTALEGQHGGRQADLAGHHPVGGGLRRGRLQQSRRDHRTRRDRPQ